MPLRITCQFCEAKLSVRDDKRGRQLRCPSGRSVNAVPSEIADDQGAGFAPGDNSASESSADGSENFSFTEEFDLEGLIPETDPVSEDLSRMPARKQTSGVRKDKSSTVTTATSAVVTKARNHCEVCRKQLDRGVRYCSGCGHNNFDTVAATVNAHMKIQTRMEQLSASLGVARILKSFGRMFR